jgi:hypothetical protein
MDTRPRPAKGLIAFLTRVTGIKLLQQRLQDKERSERHRQQVSLLTKKHDRERQDIDRQARDLKALETRERLSLQTALHRAEFMEMARPHDRETVKQTDTGKESTITNIYRKKDHQHEKSKEKGRDRNRDPGRER